MTALRISNFGGLVPRLSARALPESGARVATNCTVLSGELRPIRKPKKVYEPPLASSLRSMFRFDDTKWYTWPNEFVQMVRAPIEGEPRYCYTGDGVPKVVKKPATTFSRASTASYFDSSGILQTAAVDVPRLNYDPSDLSKSPSNLVENSATNLLLRSQDFSVSPWGRNNCSVASAVAPNGLSQPCQIIRTGAGNHYLYQNYNATSPANQTFTFSVWLKAGTMTGTVRVWLKEGANNNIAYITVTPTNSWTRFFVTGTYPATAAYIGCYIDPLNDVGVAGDTFYMWGAQLELGFVATSYIPTTSVIGTRAADIYDYGITAAGSPENAQTLGIPTPLAEPIVTVGDGTSVSASASRFYVYTFYSENNEESSPSPASALVTGKVDASWSITGMDLTPANTGTITAVSKSASSVTLTLNGNHYYRAGDVMAISNVLGMTDLNGSWVIDSVPSNIQVTIQLTTTQTYTSGGTWLRAAPWGNCTKRLYRTSSGSKADFQLVALDITGSSFTDTLTDLDIPGDSIVSEGWVPPPPNMDGLVALSNGVLAGFYGNTVCLSEPYQPHAWPVSYRRKIGSDIVGIASFDTNIGVATVGNPVILTGTEPEQMIPVKHNKPLPCLSRASVCGVGDGVVYSSKNGLVKIDITDAGLFTSVLFGPEEWNSLIPSTVKLAFDGTKIYMSTESGVVYIFNTVEGGALTTTNQTIDGMYADEATGDLYFAYLRKVYVLESFTSAPLTTDWWGREYVLPAPVNWGAVRLEWDDDYTADAAAAIVQEQADAVASNVKKITSIGGRGSIGARAVNAQAINGSFLDMIPSSMVSVSFSLYAKERLIYTGVLQNGVVTRLPAGYKSDTFSVRLQSNTQIRALVLADTPGNLANA